MKGSKRPAGCQNRPIRPIKTKLTGAVLDEAIVNIAEGRKNTGHPQREDFRNGPVAGSGDECEDGHCPVQQFLSAMQLGGLVPAEDITAALRSGAVVRFHAEGDVEADGCGWAVLVGGDQPCGAFGHYDKHIHGHWRFGADTDYADRNMLVRSEYMTPGDVCLSGATDVRAEIDFGTKDGEMGLRFESRILALAESFEVLAAAMSRTCTLIDRRQNTRPQMIDGCRRSKPEEH